MASCLMSCFCTFTHYCQGTDVNVLLLATINKEKYAIKVYPISLYVQGWQQRNGWYAWLWVAIPIFGNLIFYWTSQSHFQGHACSNLASLAFGPERRLYMGLVASRNSALPELKPVSTHLCAFMKICLFLRLYQLIIAGFSPDVKASFR